MLECSKYINTPFLTELKNINGAYYIPYEDWFMCVYARELYEEQGIKFCPFDLACQFSKESIFEENKHLKTFGCHKC